TARIRRRSDSMRGRRPRPRTGGTLPASGTASRSDTSLLASEAHNRTRASARGRGGDPCGMRGGSGCLPGLAAGRPGGPRPAGHRRSHGGRRRPARAVAGRRGGLRDHHGRARRARPASRESASWTPEQARATLRLLPKRFRPRRKTGNARVPAHERSRSRHGSLRARVRTWGRGRRRREPPAERHVGSPPGLPPGPAAPDAGGPSARRALVRVQVLPALLLLHHAGGPAGARDALRGPRCRGGPGLHHPPGAGPVCGSILRDPRLVDLRPTRAGRSRDGPGVVARQRLRGPPLQPDLRRAGRDRGHARRAEVTLAHAARDRVALTRFLGRAYAWPGPGDGPQRVFGPVAQLGESASLIRMRSLVQVQPGPPREEDVPMGEESEDTKKKRGFFGKLFRLAFIGAVVAGVVAFFKRRRGQDFDENEWQELPPPAGG